MTETCNEEKTQYTIDFGEGYSMVFDFGDCRIVAHLPGSPGAVAIFDSKMEMFKVYQAFRSKVRTLEDFKNFLK